MLVIKPWQMRLTCKLLPVCDRLARVPYARIEWCVVQRFVPLEHRTGRRPLPFTIADHLTQKRTLSRPRPLPDFGRLFIIMLKRKIPSQLKATAPLAS
jgi:hypothetical protein